MAVVIVATVGDAAANSYVTLVEAQTYMDGRLNSTTWDSASTDEQNRALVEATRELDVLTWAGWRTDDVQALSWPRTDVVDPDSSNGWDYESDVIPVRVKDACAELAFQFLKAGSTDVAALDSTAGVIRKKVDVLETEWAAPQLRATGLARYPRVWDRVAPLLDGSGGPAVDVVRG